MVERSRRQEAGAHNHPAGAAGADSYRAGAAGSHRAVAEGVAAEGSSPAGDLAVVQSWHAFHFRVITWGEAA
ncbi:hypothetical protein MHPYR_60059 [uncultured Mycobacterium sp.]|uniref:Uncharacterized protein n=1 Tax=uncultured Mycobacterium sp. TaxID=171292 RepID=A0A1Y5PQY4_9MYCO|nr:hypothetical protein MHPYR_60059 [uncultured Mycobacterium sp.]